MEDGLSIALAWMPNVESFCGADIELGVLIAEMLYMLLSLVSVIKPIFSIEYHHAGNTFITYMQCVFVYMATFFGIFAFILSIPVLLCIQHEDLTEYGRTTLLFVLFCLLMGFCDVIWGIAAFARAFVDPGLFVLTNGITNPYGQKCRSYGSSRGGRSRGRRCSYMTDEEKRKRDQWAKDHENDTIHEYKFTSVDAVISFCYTVINLFGFYPLIAFRAFLRE